MINQLNHFRLRPFINQINHGNVWVDAQAQKLMSHILDLSDPIISPWVIPKLLKTQKLVKATLVWRASNNLDKQLWADQCQNDLIAEAEEILCEQDLAEQWAILLTQEQEALCKEEMKKNKIKYIPIPDQPMPTTMPVFTSNYALKKMEKGLYIELWYYTNKGLDNAMKTSTTVNDDAIVISWKPDRSTTWETAASTRDSNKVINNRNIPWEDFCQAVPRMLIAMEEADWLADCIFMLAAFWGTYKSTTSGPPLIPWTKKLSSFTRPDNAVSGTWPHPHLGVPTTFPPLMNLSCARLKKKCTGKIADSKMMRETFTWVDVLIFALLCLLIEALSPCTAHSHSHLLPNTTHTPSHHAHLPHIPPFAPCMPSCPCMPMLHTACLSCTPHAYSSIPAHLLYTVHAYIAPHMPILHHACPPCNILTLKTLGWPTGTCHTSRQFQQLV